MNINELFSDVPFDDFVKLQSKYKLDLVSCVITKYYHILNHMIETTPNRSKNWYKLESIRRLDNYFKSIHPK